MNRTILAAAAVTLSLISVAPAFGQAIYNPATNRYYALIPFATDVFTARKIAADMGGKLASIHSLAERNFLTSAFAGALSSGGVFIGLSDEVTEGVFQWDDGTVVNYLSWNGGEPSNTSNEDWVEMGASGSWNDIPRYALRRGLVEGAALSPILAGGADFGEDFTQPVTSALWGTGPEWQIAPAFISVGHGAGNPDPIADGSGVVLGRLAGIVVGGNASIAPHPTSYLTSPPVQIPAGRRAVLKFDRFLNTIRAPYMTNTVEVFDGSAWQTIWTNPTAGSLFDADWKYQGFDVSAYVNSAFRVRFGLAVIAGNFPPVSSWNVDNVAIYSYQIDSVLAYFRPNGPGSLGLRNIAFPAGATVLTAFTLNQGAFPNGWFFGIDVTASDLGLALSTPLPPFWSTMSPTGTSDFLLLGGVPPGLSIYAVSVLLGSTGIPAGSSAPITFST